MRWFFASLAALFVAVLALETVQFVEAQFARSWLLGSGFAFLVAAVLFAAGLWTVQEVRALARLRHVGRYRVRLAGASEPEALRLQLALLLDEFEARPELAEASRRFRSYCASPRDPDALRRGFSATVLEPLDKAAYGCVLRGARDMALITAMSPTALLDTAIYVWRAVRMVREIAEVYGFRPGIAGTWYLVKRLAGGAAVLGMTDMAADLVAQQLGGTVMDALAARLGESAVASSRMARLGLITMQICRPLQFTADDVPTFRSLAAQLVDREPSRSRPGTG